MRTFVVALLLALSVTVAAPAGAGQPPPTTSPPAAGAPGIIPEPGSGVAPADAGDRGGSLQTLLFFGLVVAVGGIGVVVVRQSRRARAARGF